MLGLLAILIQAEVAVCKLNGKYISYTPPDNHAYAFLRSHFPSAVLINHPLLTPLFIQAILFALRWSVPLVVCILLQLKQQPHKTGLFLCFLFTPVIPRPI